MGTIEPVLESGVFVHRILECSCLSLISLYTTINKWNIRDKKVPILSYENFAIPENGFIVQ